MARAGRDGLAGCWRRSPSTSTSPSRWPRPRRSSARSSPSPPRCRAGTPVAACSCSTSRRPCSRRARSSGSSRSCATCATTVPASSTCPTASTRSSSLADRVTVLRNGEAGRRPATSTGLTKGELVHLMLGVEMEPDYRRRSPEQVPPRRVLEVAGPGRHVPARHHRSRSTGARCSASPAFPTRARRAAPRRSPTARRYASGGRVRLARRRGVDRHRRVEGHRRVALLPPDRGREGIVGPMRSRRTCRCRCSTGSDRPSAPPPTRAAASSNGWIDKLDVRPPARRSPIQTLSGGNQQKVLFGRTLARDPKVLVLCEPTAGVDIGARHAIYDLVAEQVRQGLSVIVASSDVGDLLRCAPGCSCSTTGSSPASSSATGSPSTSWSTPWKEWRARPHHDARPALRPTRSDAQSG